MNENIIRLLLTYPKKEWKQKELVLKTGYSKGFISQEIKTLLQEGIISKIGNKIILTDFSKLLNRWVGIRKLPKPIYFRTLNIDETEKKLKKSNLNYALTLFSAAWYRIKFFKVEKIEVYVKKDDINKIKKLFGKEDIVGNIEVYFDDNVFIGKEKVKGLYLVSTVQNYVDLMSVGGNGTRVAMQLAKKYELI